MTISTAPAVARGGPRGDTRRPGGTARRWRGNPALTLLAVALGVMMVGIDGTIVAVANPAIQSHLHASLAGIQWVSNVYLLALAVSLIPAGQEHLLVAEPVPGPADGDQADRQGQQIGVGHPLDAG